MKNELKKYWVYLFLICMSILPLLSVSKSLIISILLMFLIIVLSSRLKIPKYPLFIFLFSFFTRMIIVLVLNSPVESDFNILYSASKSIINNDYSFLNDMYFKLWPYQMGFVYYQSLLLRICNSLLFLKTVNCVITSFINVFIYLISKEFSSEKSARIVSLIYLLLPFSTTYVTILTNQFISSLLVYIAFYIIISNKIKIKDTYKYILASILIGLSNVLRPEGIIPLFSIILFLILMITKENYKLNIKKILLTIFIYFTVTLSISTLFNISGLTENGLSNNDPYWKFVLGFNHDTAGSYSESDTKLLANKEAEIEVIKSRVLTSPIKLCKLFIKKINTFWLSTALGWSFNHLYGGEFTLLNYSFDIANFLIILEQVNNNVMFISYILLIFGVYRYINKKTYNQNILLLVTQVFVTFGVYLLVEVQPRYAYHIQIDILILAALGIHELIECINKKRIKKQI